MPISTSQTGKLNIWSASKLYQVFDSFSKVVPLIQGAEDSHIRDRSYEWLKQRYELFVRITVLE